jgi:hypothetical protein
MERQQGSDHARPALGLFGPERAGVVRAALHAFGTAVSRFSRRPYKPGMRAARAALVCACLLGGGAAAEPVAVDLELVIAVDVSFSMDPREQRAQRAGYVAAFQTPELVRAVLGGALGRIAVTYIEWGGRAVQVLPWTVIAGPGTATEFAEELRRQPMRRISFTSISNALAFARELMRSNRFQGYRRVIDISGDGPNNAGAPAPVARNAAVAEGIVVNGLPIMLERAPDSASMPAVDVYYENCVIGGDGAFLLTVSEIAQFAEAIRNKLIFEISGPKLSETRSKLKPAVVQYTKPYNCFVGEEELEKSD